MLDSRAMICLRLILFTVLALPHVFADAAEGVGDAVFPCRDQPVLASIELRGPWQFLFDPRNEGAAAGWYDAITNTAAWEAVTIPRVWNIPDGAVTRAVARTIGWYRLSVPVPPEWDQDVTLAFLGAQYTADVWVNGEYVGVHRGGFTPFRMDVTAMARATNELRLAIRVSNVVDNNTVPAAHCGWQHYGGLCREVYLLHQPTVRPASIDISWRVVRDSWWDAVLQVPFLRPPPHASKLRARLEYEGRFVAGAECAIETNSATPLTIGLSVREPLHLWSPSNPVLHQLTLEWAGGRHTMPVGMRTLRVDGERLLLNEQPIWLQGFGQHEVAPGNGPIVPRDLRRRDLEQMKRVFNANVIRPGHYPNHPDLYNLCDDLGMLVFAEIPVWQMGGAILASDDTWNLWIEPQLGEMTESLRHHPSVCLWGIANETRGAHAYYRRAADYLHRLDPSRPVSVVLEPTSDLDSGPVFDMETRNFHFGWYHSHDVYDGTAIAERVFAATRGRPFLVTETGGLANRGSLNGGYSDQARGSETYLDRILRFNFAYYATVTNTVNGICVWSWTDFPRGGGVEPHGVFDVLRQPKLAAYSLVNQMRGDLRLYAVEMNSFVATGGTWRADIRTFNRMLSPRKGLTARWTVLKGQTNVGGGEIAFDVTPERSQFVAHISWAPPANAPPGLYAVWTELLDGGRRIHISGNVFDLYRASRPGVLRITPPSADTTNQWITLGGVQLPVYPFVGLQIPLEEGDYSLNAGEGTQAFGVLPCKLESSVVTTLPWPSP